MKVILTTAVALLLLIGAATASANTSTTTFSDPSFTVGTGHTYIDGIDGWTMTSANADYDAGIVANGVEGQSLRVSSLVASGSFGDWIFSKPVTEPASENQNQGFTSEFAFKALGKEVKGSHLSISPSDGKGGRMSYVRLEDNPEGVQVFFVDNPNHLSWQQDERWIATLDRTQPHTIKFVMSLLPGEDNDIVNVYVDGVQKACGSSWESYYRYVERDATKGGDELSPLYLTPTDRLIIQARGLSTDFGETPPENRGFLIDDVTTTTTAQGKAVACPLPVGPRGDKGDTGATGAPGTNGVNGTTGATGAAGQTIITGESAVAPRLIGNTRRVLHVPQRKGERLLSARATLRNNRLRVHGPRIMVDLRGKVVGNYNVFIVAKYRTKSGKVHVHRTHRSLSVTRALAEARMPA